MKTVRLVVSIVVSVVLVGGYAASQLALVLSQQDPSSANDIVDYSAKVDTPPVHYLMLVLFLACLALALFREREDGGV